MAVPETLGNGITPVGAVAELARQRPIGLIGQHGFTCAELGISRYPTERKLRLCRMVEYHDI